jgi:deoxyribonuclease-4
MTRMFGSHPSIAGDMSNALREAESLGMDTVQVFTKNQRQWRIAPLKDDAAQAWLDELERLGWQDRTVAHDSYLINLASPDDELWEKSIVLMREELDRAGRLSIPYLVSHPGAYTTSDVDSGIDRIAKAYKRLFADTRGSRVTLCLENTAGGGSTLGRTLEELADIRARIVSAASADAKGRVGFCIDTCHALAAGYDVSTEEKTRSFFDQFESVCGLEHLKVLHLNDSKGALGSRVDRHEHIGKGQVGSACFAAIVNDPRLADVPKILETPKGETEKGTPLDTLNLRRLKRMVRQGVENGGAKRPKSRGRAKTGAR